MRPHIEPKGETLSPQMQKDIQDITEYWRWNTKGAWKTNISRKQIGQLTQWMRGRIMSEEDTIFTLNDDKIFEVRNYDSGKKEKEAQNKIYDALNSGQHGQRIEREGHKDYIFKMEWHSFHGWVPHSHIYAWIKVHAGTYCNMTPEMFWHILLHTIGNVDHEYSYRVIYWPGMNMAFVK
eukprot:728933-Heterocapsa_arctica.AAC.1